MGCPWLSGSGKFGPVLFEIPIRGLEGIIGGQDDWYWYWIEVIDYNTSQSASRIVCSRRRVGELQAIQYNPLVRGGPWYYDKDEDNHYMLKKTRTYNKEGTRKHTLEFLRLGAPYGWSIAWRQITSWRAIDHSDYCKRHKDCPEKLYTP